MKPPEVRTGVLVGYSCDACQDLHKTVVVFRPIGDEVRICAGCLHTGLGLLGYVVVPTIPTSAEDEAVVDALVRRRRARDLLESVDEPCAPYVGPVVLG